MTVIIDYLIVFLVAIIALSLPDIYAIYSGVHLDRTITLVCGLAVIYAVISFQMRRRTKREDAKAAPVSARSVAAWILVSGIVVAMVYLTTPFIVDAIWPVAK